MKRLIRFLALLALTTSALVVYTPASAAGSLQVSCNGSTQTLVISSSLGSLYLTVYENGAVDSNFNGSWGGLVTATGPAFAIGTIVRVVDSVSGGDVTVTCTSASAPPPPPNFTDGRCNQEPWQSFAVYPDNKGGYIFYALYDGVGNFAMHVTKQQIKDHPDTGMNHIIAQAQGIQLYRLQGGVLQAHRIGKYGKDYWYNLDGCGTTDA